MQYNILFLALLSSASLADPIYVSSSRGSDTGSRACAALPKIRVLKDDQGSETIGPVKRDTSLDHCGVSGYIKQRNSEGPSQNHVSFDRCADYCVCTLGEITCRSFEWNEDASKRGLGHCQIHTVTLNKYNHRSLPAKRDERPAPIFYNHNCFQKEKRELSPMTGLPFPLPTFWPVPFPTTTSSEKAAKRTAMPTVTSKPVVLEKREPKAKVDNLVVDALLGV